MPTEYLALLAGGNAVDVRLSRSWHGIAGAEGDLLIIPDDLVLDRTFA